MIAYPSIKKIEVEDGRILIEKLNQQFEESTETVVSSDDAKSSRKGVNQEEIKEQLAKQILEVEERPTTTEKSKIEIGKAYMNIGNEEKAEEIIEEVLIENPTNKKAVELKEKIAVKKLEVSK